MRLFSSDWRRPGPSWGMVGSLLMLPVYHVGAALSEGIGPYAIDPGRAITKMLRFFSLDGSVALLMLDD